MSASYLARRLLAMVYTLLVVSIIVFGVTQILPADAATVIMGENATPEQLAALRDRLGLNDLGVVQYLRWLSGVLTGEFGASMRTGQPVLPTILEALSRSLTLAALSIALMLVVALPLGILAATKRGGPVDVLFGLVSYVGVSLPEFVTATLVILLLADWLQLLPATGYVPLTDNLWVGLRHLALPVLTVSIILIAHVSRMVRSEMVDALHSDYVRAARLKGLSENRVVYVHALRNALLPTITIVALDVGYVLGGIIVVEEIFAIPGLGRQLIVSIQARDLPMIQAGAAGARLDLRGHEPSGRLWLRSPRQADPVWLRSCGVSSGHPQGAIGLAIIALVLIAVLFGPWLAPRDPFAISPLQRYRPPGPVNFLGTDHLGRDLLSRVLHGASATVVMAIIATPRRNPGGIADRHGIRVSSVAALTS